MISVKLPMVAIRLQKFTAPLYRDANADGRVLHDGVEKNISRDTPINTAAAVEDGEVNGMPILMIADARTNDAFRTRLSLWRPVTVRLPLGVRLPAAVVVVA